MIESLKTTLSDENLLTIIGFACTIFVAFITAFLTSKNNNKSITSDYFKREGINVQERILKFWSSLLLYDFNKCIEMYKKNIKLEGKIDDVEIIKLISHDAILYSSKSTIKAIATYQHYLYKNNKNGKKTKEEKNSTLETMKLLIISSRVIKKMKYDFTGEKVDIIDLLKIRINDLDNKKILLSRILIIYYNFIENVGKLIIAIILLIMIILFKYKILWEVNCNLNKN